VTDALPGPGREIPAPHTPEELRIAAGFSRAASDRYPVQISVYCDTCHGIVTHDYIVTDDVSREQRWELARAHLRRFGWRCDLIGDFCPEHGESL
jgi:hypothetical protein